MTTWAVLASGPSMSQAIADSVKGHCKVVAVSDTYKLAPWSDVLVSSDRAWWQHHQPEFRGRRFSAVDVPGVEKFEGIHSGSNSGLVGLKVAVHFGATRVLLLGFDMGGTHYFGEHPAPLKNTKPHRFEVFKSQFASFKPRGVEIINCTEGSALKCYPMARLEDVLEGLAESQVHSP